MSALSDVAAAMLPPEAGGPPPRRVAAAARRLIAQMPRSSQAGLGAGLVGIEAISLATTGRKLGALPPERRELLLRRLAGGPIPGQAALDALKAILLLSHGADSFSAEIGATANAHEPSNPDGELDLIPAGEWPDTAAVDAVVVGSGAGGAFAARALARAGLDTVVVEEGERWDVGRIRSSDPIERFASLYRGGGATVALGIPPIALPLGRAVGGTTVVNSGTCYRPPARVARSWHERHGMALAAPDGLDRRLDDVEATLRVAPVPLAVMGRNGKLALAGAEALGWESGPLRRNAPGCRGACQCALGCPNNAKAGVHMNALPQACEAGARIVSGLRAGRVLVERGRAAGVEATRADGSGVRISAPIVVVAAGTIHTPPLLRRSGIGGHPRLGRNLSIHPAVGVTAPFAEEVLPWRGVLQSAGVEELREREGILIEATSAPPGMTSMAVAGYGASLVRRLDAAANTATLGAMIADAPSGRVIGSGRPVVVYRLKGDDRRRLVTAVGEMTRVMLAAGAERVELGGGAPAVRDAAEIPAALERLDVRRLHLAAFHPTGTAAAGGDPARHPVSPDGALRGVEGVWVADGSILPSCPGVNPQLSIMALAAGVGANAAGARTPASSPGGASEAGRAVHVDPPQR